MNEVLKLYISMSLSGGLLIVILLLGKQFWKNRVSRQWQYYIWMVVILRLLVPCGPERNLLGNFYQTAGQAVFRTAVLPQPQSLSYEEGEVRTAEGLDRNVEFRNDPAQGSMAVQSFQDVRNLLSDHMWLIWLVAALMLLIRKITIYQGFVRYIHAGMTPVSDVAVLDRLAVTAKRAGIKKPVELCVHPLISSPLLIGFFHPCIVLPSEDISEEDFPYIVLHELMHYKRFDMLYKWLVQITVCLHWYNPLVHVMNREIIKACEFSCDEAVVMKTGYVHAKEYGQTLLNAMSAVGNYQEKLGSVTLNENKRLLKERLGAIMKKRKSSGAVTFLTGLFTLCVVLGAAFAGVYQIGTGAGNVYAAEVTDSTFTDTTDKALSSAVKEKSSKADVFAGQAEQYYENWDLPMFSVAFSRMDEEEREKWLERIYTDGDITFWGAAVGQMEEDALEGWLDKALADENMQFLAVLCDALDCEEVLEGKEKEWEEAQLAEYQAAGITVDGKNYYYQGQLVNVFLDVRSTDRSFYTLNMNPKGTVDIRIIRGEDEAITGVAYLTEEEIEELFGSEK